jgi:hypothetical protein
MSNIATWQQGDSWQVMQKSGGDEPWALVFTYSFFVF